jgi:hypothetical protein
MIQDIGPPVRGDVCDGVAEDSMRAIVKGRYGCAGRIQRDVCALFLAVRDRACRGTQTGGWCGALNDSRSDRHQYDPDVTGPHILGARTMPRRFQAAPVRAPKRQYRRTHPSQRWQRRLRGVGIRTASVQQNGPELVERGNGKVIDWNGVAYTSPNGTFAPCPGTRMSRRS